MKKVACVLAMLTLAGCEGPAERAVRAAMLDPDATQFRNVETCPADRSITRGEFNGKNGFGAYTGFSTFYYSKGHLTFIGDADFLDRIEACYGNVANKR